jgi:hypothetical protein
MKVIATAVFLSFQALCATPSQEDHEKAVMNPDYFVHVILSGIVKDMIFPGPPNFVSVDEGDWAEPRWILDVDEQSLARLAEAQAGVTDHHYMGEFIRAVEGEPPGISVVYYDTDGNKTIRYHEKNGKVGSHAWRNNNPGNLAYGDGSHAKATGCIGVSV